MSVPYDRIDANIADLVRALNEIPGLRTSGSCGGHDEPRVGQNKSPRWSITFNVDRTPAGWDALEHLALSTTHGSDGLFGHNGVTVRAIAVRRDLNESVNPGEDCMFFSVSGECDPNGWLLKWPFGGFLRGDER